MKIPHVPEILTEVEEEILHLLLKNPLSNKYEVCEKLRRSYSNIYNAMKSLVSKGLVEIADVRVGKRNQKIPVECYRVTEKGAVHVLESIRFEVKSRLIWNDEDPFKDVPMDVVAAIVKEYPNLFPLEFQHLTERFASILAAAHAGTYTYLAIIRAKLSVEAPKDTFIKRALEAVTEKDLGVLINMTGRMLNEEIQKMEEELQRKKEQLKFLEGIKTKS